MKKKHTKMKLKKRKQSKKKECERKNGTRSLSVYCTAHFVRNEYKYNIFELTKIQIQKYDFRTTENPNKCHSNIVVGCVIKNRRISKYPEYFFLYRFETIEL